MVLLPQPISPYNKAYFRLKNEACDWLSRVDFDKIVGIDFYELAQNAFDKMDLALDFAILYKVSDSLKFESLDY